MSNNFKESIKFNPKPLDIMQFNTKKEQKSLDIMKFQTNQSAKNKEYIKKEVHKIPKKKTKRKAKTKGLSKLGLGTIITLGAAYGGITHWQNSQAVTLEEAKEAGKTLEQLKITPEQYQKLEELKQIIDQDSITNYELLTSLDSIEELNMDMQKTKIAKATGKDKESVSLFTGIDTAEKGKTKEVITVDGIKYGNSDMSEEIANSIKDLGNIQVDNYNMQNGNINKEKLKNKVKKYIETTSKMAASELEEVNGKIEMKPTTKGEVKKLKEEQQKQQEDFER